MANIFYPKFKAACLRGQQTHDLSSAGVNVKAVLVDTAAYAYSATHEFLSDIPSGARIATSGNLSGKTVSDAAVWDATDPTMTATGSPASVEAVVFYVDTGVEGTSRLVIYGDTFTSGMPFTPAASSTFPLEINAAGIGTL